MTPGKGEPSNSESAAPIKRKLLGIWQQGKTFADYLYLEQSAKLMLDDLFWWTNTLTAGRAFDETTAKVSKKKYA